MWDGSLWLFSLYYSSYKHGWIQHFSKKGENSGKGATNVFKNVYSLSGSAKQPQKPIVAWPAAG